MNHYFELWFSPMPITPLANWPLEVTTPTPPLSGRGCHALTWRSHGHSLPVTSSPPDSGLTR